MWYMILTTISSIGLLASDAPAQSNIDLTPGLRLRPGHISIGLEDTRVSAPTKKE